LSEPCSWINTEPVIPNLERVGNNSDRQLILAVAKRWIGESPYTNITITLEVFPEHYILKATGFDRITRTILDPSRWFISPEHYRRMTEPYCDLKERNVVVLVYKHETIESHEKIRDRLNIISTCSENGRRGIKRLKFW
jgi:hypothetical protein